MLHRHQHPVVSQRMSAHKHARNLIERRERARCGPALSNLRMAGSGVSRHSRIRSGTAQAGHRRRARTAAVTKCHIPKRTVADRRAKDIERLPIGSTLDKACTNQGAVIPGFMVNCDSNTRRKPPKRSGGKCGGIGQLDFSEKRKIS